MIEVDVLKQESLPPIDIGSKYSLEPKEETLSQLGEFLQKRLSALRTLRERSDWEREKAAAFNAYHMIPRERALPYPGAANLACPLPRIGVDSFHANVMGSLYSDENRMKIMPLVIQKDFTSKAGKAAQYMTYVMNHEADSYMAFDDADKKAQMFGVGYLEPVYVKEEIWETVEVTETKRTPAIDEAGNVQLNEKTTTRREKKRKTVFDGIKINSLPVESIYRSPFMSMEEAVRSDAVFKVFQINYSEIKSRTKSTDDRPAYYRKSQVDKLTKPIVGKMFKQLTELEQARASNDGFFIDLLSREELVEVAEAHCWWDIDGDDIKEKITATFHPATGTVLRVTLSPCRIVDLDPRPVDERGYGEGIPKISIRLSDEWEMFHNTRANAGQWENTTFGFYRAGGRMNPQQITIQPGHFYPVDDPREINFAQTPRVGSSYFQEEQMLLSYFERIFALDENMQGVGSSRKRTATESLKVASRASVRFGNPFNRIVTKVNKLLGHIWDLNRECAPEEKEFYVIGEGGSPLFEKMHKYEYSANMQFGVAVNTVFDQQIVRDTMLLAYRLFLVNPIVQQHPEIVYELSQKTLDTLQIDVDLPKPPQAKTLSAFEVIELLRSGEDIEPEVGIDYDHHLKVCMKQLNADDVKDWDVEAQKRLIMYIDKTRILKATLESANLNKSGMFTGGPMQQQPGVTSNRNPTQMFNTTKVGESGKSAMQNTKNGGGQDAQGAMDQVFGSSVS